MIDNLEQLLPGAPDVLAIRLAAALRHGDTPPAHPVVTPPMLLRGLVAIMDASAVVPEIVPEGGFIERIAPHLLSDSAWTTWSLQQTGMEATASSLSRAAGAEVGSGRCNASNDHPTRRTPGRGHGAAGAGFL